jgi:hypothetical protein
LFAFAFVLALCPKPDAADIHWYLLAHKIISKNFHISIACQAKQNKTTKTELTALQLIALTRMHLYYTANPVSGFYSREMRTLTYIKISTQMSILPTSPQLETIQLFINR